MLLTCGYAYNSDDKDKYLAYQCGDAKDFPAFFLMTADVRVYACRCWIRAGGRRSFGLISGRGPPELSERRFKLVDTPRHEVGI